ncbi:hypothetical protein B0H13DRAFT_443356 [Mycena leptocephala]|nr:hypothetical protein B0H13DRAFT_443356 [Mycena leptocephala]
MGTVVRRAMLFGFFCLVVVVSVMAAPSDTRLVQSIAANNTNINSTSIVQQNSDVAPSYAPSYAPSSTSVPVVATPSRMLLVETIDNNSTKINGTDTTSVIQQLSGVAAHAASPASVPVSEFIGPPLPTVAPTPSQVLIPQLDSSAVQQPNPATSSASSSAFGILLADDGGGLSSGVRVAIIIGFLIFVACYVSFVCFSRGCNIWRPRFPEVPPVLPVVMPAVRITLNFILARRATDVSTRPPPSQTATTQAVESIPMTNGAVEGSGRDGASSNPRLSSQTASTLVSGSDASSDNAVIKDAADEGPSDPRLSSHTASTIVGSEAGPDHTSGNNSLTNGTTMVRPPRARHATSRPRATLMEIPL